MTAYRRQDDFPDECFTQLHRDRCQYAEDAADRAVEKTFAKLGVDVNSPSELKKFQDSLRFGEKMLNIADRSVIAGAVVAVGMLIAALALGIKTKIMGHP